MGQTCCKADDKKTTEPAIIRPEITSQRSLLATTKEDNPVSATESAGKRIFQYQRGSLLDSNNNFIELWECLDLHTGERLAVKSYEVLGDLDKVNEDLENLQEDIDLWRELRHTNLIKCYDIELNEAPDDSHKFNIDVVMEYASGGSIESLVCKFNSFDERIVQYYTKQVLEGLIYLHSQGSVHGNLRGSNILIDSTGVVKLTDFELTNKIKSIAQENLSEDGQIQDSILWAAPEVLAENLIEQPADIWSVGCIVIEMLTGNPPWVPMDKREAFKSIISGGVPPFPNDLSENCLDFLKETFKYPPETRPSALDLLEHPFIGQSKTTDASVLGESFLTLQTIRGNGILQSLATLPRHPSSDLHAIDNPSKVRIGLSHTNIIRAKTLRRDSRISETGTDDQIEIPAKYKRNISLERYRLEGFQSRESFRRQATLPQVHESFNEEEEYAYNEDNTTQNRNKTGVKYWPKTYSKKTVQEIPTEESAAEIRENKLREEDSKKGQIINSEGDAMEKIDSNTEPDNDNKSEHNEYESEKLANVNNFAPMKRSKFQHTSKQKVDTIHDVNSVDHGPTVISDRRNGNNQEQASNKEDERRRIEEEIMNQLLRIETKDLNQEIFASSDKTLNKLEESTQNKTQEIKPSIDDKEAERKRFEEELMNQLDRVNTKDLSIHSSFRDDNSNIEKDFSANNQTLTQSKAY